MFLALLSCELALTPMVKDMRSLILCLFSWIRHHRIIFITGMQLSLTAISACWSTISNA